MKRTTVADRVIEYVLTRQLRDFANLTVDLVASSLKVNRSHLSRTFTREKGFTIEEYVFRIKLLRAASVLVENNGYSIKKVSKMMGFARSDYFIRVFKSYFGTTPAKYRALVRGDCKAEPHDMQTAPDEIIH